MRKIVKLIFRLDFKINFEIMNQQGKALQCLMAGSDNFWQSLNQSTEKVSFKGIYRAEGLYRDTTIEPITINGVLETADGIDFEKILENDSIKQYDKIVREFCSTFQVDQITRAGLRVFMFESYGERFVNPLEKFRTLFDKQFLEKFKADIGEIEDAGILLEGLTRDELNYHMHFGHFHPKDMDRIFTAIQPSADQLKALSLNHVTADIDLYEKNLSFKGLNLVKWTKDKWPVIDKFMLNYKDKMLNS